MPPTNVYDTLEERGFVQQVTDADAVRKLLEAPTTCYVGVDPTGDSMHVGHLFPIMALSHMEKAGHSVIALVGGGTAAVGDPSGKTEMRKLISREQINSNIEKLSAQIELILNISDGGSRIVNNADWLLQLNYIDFLRDVGRHFSVNRMLAAEAYKIRLEKGLSFIEFNYQLLQSYDFVELRRRYDCRLQMGGDDQWGNILAGVDLSRRMDGELLHGLTFPLQLTADGQKMGKTAAGAVWLDSTKLAPYDYYQHWVNTHDDDVQRMLGFFTYLPMDEVKLVAELEGAGLNVAKSILASAATKIIHGKDAALEAQRGAMAGFGGRSIPKDILPSSDLPRESSASVDSLPTTELDGLGEEGVLVIELLVQSELAASKSKARQLIKQNAVKLGDEKVADDTVRVKASDLAGDGSGDGDDSGDGSGAVVLRVGKKKLHRFIVKG